mmetsp:Transcript_28576/g.83634  ORF Transcript_28576/g.83634 Transcript_28576/m.83634 type:complete len:126 (+) Transcript_28576:2314-2691(+)
MAAAVRGHKQVAEALLKHKADVNAQNGDGHTALMFAYNGKNQVAAVLDKYAEYMKDQKDNSTEIIQKALETHAGIVELLIAGGANQDLTDKKGNVAIDFDYKTKEPTAEGSPEADAKTQKGKEEL